jgi:lysyl-tRNA synthetase class II
MSAEDTNALIEQRRAKLASLRFANKFTPTEGCVPAKENYVEGRAVALAGRLTALREMGKSLFFDIKDQTGRIQVYVQKQAVGDDNFKILQHLDLGDFVGVKGALFTTKMGEKSVKLESFTILGKALRPPPSKWYGLEDTETRYRQRYLDLIANDDVKDVFLKRSAIVHEIRQFFHARGYVEVETPAMQGIPGGAAAAPFKTFHNALGCEFYLRIALELYHKRLLVGGIDKLFEIGKNFRNEGLSRRHNPEFTMLEAYQAFGDYETMRETVESLICHVAEKVLGTLVIRHSRKAETETAIRRALRKFEGEFGRVFVEMAKARKTQLVARWFGETAEGLPHELRDLIKKLEVQPAASVAEAALDLVKRGMNDIAFAKDQIRNVEGLSEEIIARDIEPWHRVLEEVSGDFSAAENALLGLVQEKVIDLSRPWKCEKYKDLVRKKAGADWFDIAPAERRQRAHDLGAEIGKDYEDFEITGAVFEKLIEPTLIQPTFVTHLPKELVPLAKLSPDDPTTVEVFECCINGQEIAPGYTEQNDPIAQRNTLEHQAGGEQQKLDEDFLVALEHGMPPAGGIGIGIDRLCMMLLGQESIRDVILFPQMKPK